MSCDYTRSTHSFEAKEHILSKTTNFNLVSSSMASSSVTRLNTLLAAPLVAPSVASLVAPSVASLVAPSAAPSTAPTIAPMIAPLVAPLCHV
ncbi:hypothetical protein G6F17_013420 [Rhizopus arrhizus]|nr:hypothetical protein G6F18_013453 [Rhizopus arrhizus]KAG0846436.1 hypothetical protein G6F17_013420 [Rhizopus arrhizus]KAG0883575.1 hypothetical protein G6F34_013444 [Rhizopus arrhizus]KAG0897231.1 hypothetical protein G6F33_013457 [Rhizopus arrhizus]KAG1073056.1 hypothetical protein G6F42_025849 [Rhizopus arrhizus]